MYTKTVRKPNKNKRISPSETAFIGAIITLIGGFFISYNYIESQKIMAYDYMANAFYDGNQVTVEDKENKIDGIKEKITGIKDIKLIKENEDKTKRYEITGENDVNLNKTIFNEFAKENITIIEMKKAEATLEDAFMKIIKEGGDK